MIIGSDFDGTIFIDEKISEKDIKAIKDFQEAGNLFAIITGRSLVSLNPLIKGKIEPDAIIGNNGGHIYIREDSSYKEVFKARIEKEKAKEFLNFYKKHIINDMVIFTDNKRLENLSYVDEDIMALAIYSDDKITNYFPEDFDFHYSIGVIDVVKKGINKQRGIEFLKDYYSYNKDIIAIGDDYNDIDFLKETPLSYTLDYVTNDKVRKAANFTVESVASLIEELMGEI